MQMLYKTYYPRLIEKKVYQQRRKKRNKKNIRQRKVFCFDKGGSVRSYYTNFIQQLNSNGFIKNKYAKKVIKVPACFSFKKDFDNNMIFFKEFISSYLLSNGYLTISFKHCKESSIANFSVLDVLIKNLSELKNRYNQSKYVVCEKIIKVERSDYDIKTNKYLHSFLHKQLPAAENDGSCFMKLPLEKGKRRNYKENPKTRVSSLIVHFVNKCVEKAGASLKLDGQRAIEGLMGEILSNAEDHSAPNSFWYVDGISFVEKQDDTEVVDLNLTIMNIGPSMYGGFEGTKLKNAPNYEKCQKLYDLHKSQFSQTTKFERESLFTMYLLNDGISRLKYTDQSRGNGTIRFLESFIILGCYGLENEKFKCQLNVISGHTVLTCDNDMHPFVIEKCTHLALNKEKDFKKLPDKRYLCYNKEYFPGTILECHIFLNKDFFSKKMNNN